MSLSLLDEVIVDIQNINLNELELGEELLTSEPEVTTSGNLLESFLKKGYFPAELPPPFTANSYAKTLVSSREQLKAPFSIPTNGPKYISKPIRYNISRRGSLRRKLSIPNPVNHYQMSSMLSDNWNDIFEYYHESNRALSKPFFGKKRCLEWEKGFGCLPEICLETRNASKYILKADINSFYPSIYTHSIPWALHTKEIAKKKRYYKNNLGNKLDKIIQNSQDGQTKGIPISPDSSFVIGEIISVAIDKELEEEGITKYHRYIDDYEFGCSSRQEAEKILSKLQEILDSYELSLNPNKTTIIELPVEINPFWIKQLSELNFRESGNSQKADLHNFFDISVRAHKQSENEAVIQYSLTKIMNLEISKDNWGTYQNILLQWAIIEPSILHNIIDLLLVYKENSYPLNIEAMKDTFIAIIKENSSIGHTGEVAWAIWACLVFNINIDEVSLILSKSENSVIALLVLDAQNKGLIDEDFEFVKWKSVMKQEELKSENWLLTYEAYMKNWLPSISGVDYLKNSEGFNVFQENNVNFYNSDLSAIYRPKIQLFNASDMIQYGRI